MKSTPTKPKYRLRQLVKSDEWGTSYVGVVHIVAEDGMTLCNRDTRKPPKTGRYVVPEMNVSNCQTCDRKFHYKHERPDSRMNLSVGSYRPRSGCRIWRRGRGWR